MAKHPRAYIDFETRSEVNLKKTGTWRYAVDPTTEPLVMAFRLPSWKTGRTEIWTPEYPRLGILHQGGNFDALFELFDWITAGNRVEAHNAWFERNIWRHIMVPRFGWPAMPPNSWMCSAAQAAAVAYPRGLDDALAAAKLALRKDAPGTKVMKKMTKPRKPRKAEREKWHELYGDTPVETLYFESPELLDQLFKYVRQDVIAEEGLSYVLPDLSPEEQELYWLDQRINDIGFQIDPDAVSAALRLIMDESVRLNAELAELTAGDVMKATQRAQLMAWLKTQGVDIDNTQAATLDDLLAHWPETGSPAARRAVEILRILGRSSTSKYEAMRLQKDPFDHRMRGGLLFHGASTGRWTGVGVQPQNFPKGSLKPEPDETPDTFVERLWDVIKTLDRDFIMTEFGGASIMEILSHALRSAIVAGPGKQLYVADYASIEARVVLWLADDEDALNVFRSGADIYLYTAEGIYKRPLTKADKNERQMGKQAVLGLGYQMGPSKFVDTLAKYGITIVEDNWCDECGKSLKQHRKEDHPFTCEDEEELTAVMVVDAYREKYWRTKQLWADQEAAAIEATKYPKRPVRAGKVTWLHENGFLWCVLPSGRRLAYARAWVSMQETAWGSTKETLQFWAVNPKNRQWLPQKTYGGMIVENITQAVSRDLMAAALVRLESHPVYQPVLSVHDEVIAEADLGTGDVHEFEKLVAELPDWAAGIPVAAEGWTGVRYRK